MSAAVFGDVTQRFPLLLGGALRDSLQNGWGGYHKRGRLKVIPNAKSIF